MYECVENGVYVCLYVWFRILNAGYRKQDTGVIYNEDSVVHKFIKEKMMNKF